MRPIDGRLGRGIKPDLADIADHADDVGRRVLAFLKALHENDHPLPERIHAGKIPIDKRLIDDDHVALLGEFFWIKLAPRMKRYLHGGKVVSGRQPAPRHRAGPSTIETVG